MIAQKTQETTSILHRSMVPPNLSGRVTKVVEDGEYTIKDTLMVLELDDGTTQELTLCQKWPIRIARPVLERYLYSNR